MNRIYLMMLLLVVSCNDHESLGDGYYYLSSGAAADMSYPYGSMLYYSSDNRLLGDSTLIYNTIMEVKKTKRYILVRQYPNRETMQRRLMDKISRWKESKESNPNDSLVTFPHGKENLSHIINLENNFEVNKAIADSMINNILFYQRMFANFSNYWIIDKTEQLLIGPLTKDDFLLKQNELDIKIKFKTELK